MFIQRPVDLGRNGPPLMWSAASVCVCVFMRVCVCVWVAVCLGWTCETGEETLHPLGPGTLGEEEERSNTLSDF